MNATRQLEQLLTDLVVTWPSDTENPAVKAACDYLEANCGISIQPGEGSEGMTANHHFDNLTEQWYSI